MTTAGNEKGTIDGTMQAEKDTATPDISVIVVTYNTATLIERCLASVLAATGVTADIRVVDNASSDGTAAVVRRDFPSIPCVENRENTGFAAANNQVLPDCTGRYVLFLNPDTEVKPSSLAAMVSFMDGHPAVGLAGARIVYPDGTPQWSVAYQYPSERYAREELRHLPGEIACVLGAAMIARADLVRTLGGFDDDYFLYGEDQDLCLRIRRAGFAIGVVDHAVVIHHGGHSEKDTQPAEVWKKKVHAEYLFYEKHYRPETIRRIRRADMIKAWWRMVTLRYFPFLEKDRARAKEKLEKYRVIYHAVRHYHGPESEG